MFECEKEEFFIGIDPSLAANAVVVINQHGEIIEEKLIKSAGPKDNVYHNPEQRVLDVFNQTKFISNILRLKCVYIEGLSYMSNSPTLFERCGLLYMILTHLFQEDVNYKIIPPTSLKKWHTTDGHADKVMMMRVAKCKWGIDFQDDNICDAYCLAMMAREEYYAKNKSN